MAMMLAARQSFWACMFSKKPDHSRRNSHSSTQEWFSKHRREEIVEKQEQMCPRADRPPARAVERNDGLGGNLPATGYIRQAGVHGGGRLFSTRTIERELNERDELIYRLLLRQLAGRVAAGEIVRAVLDRENPMQCIDVTREHWA